MAEGSKELVPGSGKLYNGTDALYDGVDSLCDSAQEMTDGTGVFRIETADMHDQLDEKLTVFRNPMPVGSDGKQQMTSTAKSSLGANIRETKNITLRYICSAIVAVFSVLKSCGCCFAGIFAW